MSDQESLFRDENQIDLFTCETCNFYSALVAPRVRSDDVVIYGYCFKHGDKDYSTNMGKGLPVFIAEGRCKQWRKKKAAQGEKGAEA